MVMATTTKGRSSTANGIVFAAEDHECLVHKCNAPKQAFNKTNAAHVQNCVAKHVTNLAAQQVGSKFGKQLLIIVPCGNF